MLYFGAQHVALTSKAERERILRDVVADAKVRTSAIRK